MTIMPAWSGLFDGVHGDGHTLINGRPRAEYIQDLMQKRGLWGYARVYASTGATLVPATRKRNDYITVSATPGPAKNSMLIPGTATDGRNPPDRDIEVLNAHGDARPLSDDNAPGDVSVADADYAVTTRKSFTYAEDKSGNGGTGLTGSPA